MGGTDLRQGNEGLVAAIGLLVVAVFPGRLTVASTVPSCDSFLSHMVGFYFL